MDTFEARLRMRHLAQETLSVLGTFVAGATSESHGVAETHRLLTEARVVLPDAGYPGEAAWRAIQRSSVGFQSGAYEPGSEYWFELMEELRSAYEVLDALTSSSSSWESDFHIVG